MEKTTNKIIVDHGTDVLEYACGHCGELLMSEDEDECSCCGVNIHSGSEEVMSPVELEDKFPNTI